MNQKGLAPVVILLIIAAIIGITVITKINQNSAQPSSPQPTPVITSTTNEKASPTPASFSKQVKPTQNPSRTPKPTPTPSASTPPNNTAAPTNPYDLNSPTGAVKVIVKPQSGDLAYTPQAELSAVSGFKVLDGRSTDKITRFGLQRNDNLRGEIIFSTAPPGPYKVRISYNGVWSDQKDVTVSSASQSTVEFTVAGQASTPAPTPRPKPVCSVLVIPSSLGTAPYQASVCVGNNSNPDQGVQQEFADYDGDGSWDYQGVQYGCHAYTFQNPGTYQPKAKIIGTSGDESDICQTSVTVN